MSICPVPKILILESQLIIAADIALQFLKLGYQVLGFTTHPENFLKSIQCNAPDIVLMNIGIRDQTNRIQMAKAILERYHTPVIVLSSNIDPAFFKELIPARPYAFIAKPFEQKDLQRSVENSFKRMAAEKSVWIMI